MSKYIDKNKVLEYIIFGVVGKNITCGELTRAIESIPSIDIVHCKDCKHVTYKINPVGTQDVFCGCYYSGIQHDGDFFCSYGERIDNE